MVYHFFQLIIRHLAIEQDCIEIRLKQSRTMIASANGAGVFAPVIFACYSVAIERNLIILLFRIKLREQLLSYLHANRDISERKIHIGPRLCQAIVYDFLRRQHSHSLQIICLPGILITNNTNLINCLYKFNSSTLKIIDNRN